MANTTISPNMNLVIPTVGVDPGPDWATNLNASLSLIDQHDHSNGNGVKITPSGLNISSDLTFQGNNLIQARALEFQSQLSLITDLDALYVVSGDLYYNDGAGNQIRVTQSGSVVGPAGSITGLVSPASATYIAGSQTFVWQADANLAATMDMGSVIIRDLTTNSFGITLQAPVLSADYSLTLPALPSQQSFMTLDAAGNMAAPWTVDNSTIKIQSNQLVVQGNAIAGSDREHAWELNGNYPQLSYPLTNIDSIFLAPYNLTITSVWIYNGVAGSSGTTEFDLKAAATPSSSYNSILSITGKISSAAQAVVWTDSNSIVGGLTGVIKPFVGFPNILAGWALRFDLLQSMAGPATDARIRIFYKQT